MNRSHSWFAIGVVTILALGIGLSYVNSLSIGFEFDDAYLITNNPWIRSLANIPRFFYDPLVLTVVRENADLRPILQITYALNYAVSGLQPWSYHLLNMAIHWVAALLVFLIVRDHLWWPASERGPASAARWPAAAAALFFALAPLNSQPLVYMSARSALLCTTLYLGAFFASLRGRRRLAAGLLALALLTKAIAITLPVMLAAYDFLYRDRTRYRRLDLYLDDWRQVARLILLTVLVDLAYLLYRHFLIPPWVTETFKQSFTTPWIWFMTEWSAYLYYVRLFLWPDALSIDHELPYAVSLLEPRAFLPLAVLVIWIGAALRWSRQQPMVAFATVWFFVTLAPESTFAPLAEVINDHRPYIATSLGLSVLLAWVLYTACARLGRRAPAVFACVCFGLCAAAVPVTWHRNWQWQDSRRIWVDATEKYPPNGRAWMNAGIAFMERGDMDTASRYFEQARVLRPNYPYVYLNISILEAYRGRLDDALRAAEEAVRLKPDLSLGHFCRAEVLEKLGRTAEADAGYRRAAEINPSDPRPGEALKRMRRDGPAAPDVDGLMRAGIDARYKLNDTNGAIAYFRQVLEKNPAHYGATYQLAAALDAAGKPAEARPLWERVLPMAEQYKDDAIAEKARVRLAAPDVLGADALMQQGVDALYKRQDGPAAVALFRQVLERAPNHYGATYQLAAALEAAGQADEARAQWMKALAMAEAQRDQATIDLIRKRLSPGS